jgi:hypothetical protein
MVILYFLAIRFKWCAIVRKGKCGENGGITNKTAEKKN